MFGSDQDTLTRKQTSLVYAHYLLRLRDMQLLGTPQIEETLLTVLSLLDQMIAML